MNVGDRVKCVKEYDNIVVGMTGKIASNDGQIGVIWDNFNSGHNDVEGSEDNNSYFVDEVNIEVISSVEEKSPLTKLKMTNKKIIKVLAVDKKTSKVLKNVSVVAENEQTAILKAFGVDVEKVYINTTEEGDFEEEKPVSVIMDKAEAKPKNKPAS